MFLVELLTWVVASIALVTLHIAMSPGRHPRLALTFANGAMFGAIGGLFGTFIRLNDFEKGRYSLVGLILAVGGTLTFLFLEWASSHQHPLPRPR